MGEGYPFAAELSVEGYRDLPEMPLGFTKRSMTTVGDGSRPGKTMVLTWDRNILQRTVCCVFCWNWMARRLCESGSRLRLFAYRN